jgi:hypothetical protein
MDNLHYHNLAHPSFVYPQILPNGNSFVLATYTNGFEPQEPGSYAISNLGVFAELLVSMLQLDVGNPAKIVLGSTISKVACLLCIF